MTSSSTRPDPNPRDQGPEGRRRSDAAPLAPPAWQPFLESLRRFVRARTPEQDADDVTQEVLLRLHRDVPSLRDETRAQAWVYTVARRTIADHYRRRREHDPLQEDDHSLGPETAEVPAGFACCSANRDLHEEVLGWLRPMAEELPDPYREALLFADFEGRTQREVAEALGLSLSGAKSRVQRARKLLGANLAACCEIELGAEGRVVDYRRRDRGRP